MYYNEYEIAFDVIIVSEQSIPVIKINVYNFIKKKERKKNPI